MSTRNRLFANKKNIAIMGGTFDPIHNGHIETAKETAAWLKVEQLLLLPAHIPPHKQSTSANAQHRAAMVKLVCQQQPLFKLDNRELMRHSSSYTVTSLQEIKQEQPTSRIFFIVGMDSLQSFTRWHNWQEILTLCHIVVNVRPGYQLTDIDETTKKLLAIHQTSDLTTMNQEDAGGIIFHQNQSFSISSSQIRHQLMTDKLKKNLLSKEVHQYIIQENLYLK